MQLPLVGKWVVKVHGVQPFAIHGDQYYELYITPPSQPTNSVAVRVPGHAFSAPPAVGQTLELSFLMGQVTAAVPAPAAQ